MGNTNTNNARQIRQTRYEKERHQNVVNLINEYNTVKKFDEYKNNYIVGMSDDDDKSEQFIIDNYRQYVYEMIEFRLKQWEEEKQRKS
jgi:hypothetical protein